MENHVVIEVFTRYFRKVNEYEKSLEFVNTINTSSVWGRVERLCFQTLRIRTHSYMKSQNHSNYNSRPVRTVHVLVKYIIMIMGWRRKFSSIWVHDQSYPIIARSMSNISLKTALLLKSLLHQVLVLNSHYLRNRRKQYAEFRVGFWRLILFFFLSFCVIFVRFKRFNETKNLTYIRRNGD